MPLRSPRFWRELIAPVLERRQERHWLEKGRSGRPPAWVTRRNIMTLADLYGAEAFVETGTFKGDTVAAVADRFATVISIEALPKYAQAARQRFANASNVTIVEGDSGTALEGAIAGLNGLKGCALFWLDSHYIGEAFEDRTSDTPIRSEIDIIYAQRIANGFADIVMIDDAHCFDGSKGYPEIEPFMDTIRANWGYTVRCADDCIFALPPLG
jgi:hypothetical protein